MGYTKVTISSGHSTVKVRGAVGCGYIENEEAVKVVNRVAEILKQMNVTANVYHDNNTTQTKNVNAIVNHHNSTSRELDVSVHFNSASATATGVEVLYLTNDMKTLSANVSAKIATTLGIRNRGAKNRTNLGFLNRTSKPAILIEVCFISNANDMNAYVKNFDKMCISIAEVISGKTYVKPNVGELNISHMGVATCLCDVAMYSEPNTNSYVKHLEKGAYKAYKVQNNMINLGGNQWIQHPNIAQGLIELKHLVLTNTRVVNMYDDNGNYIGVLGTGSWLIWLMDTVNNRINLGSCWIYYDQSCMKIS